MTDRRVLWLTPDKPDNISVGRQRIADHLETRGFDVTLRGTTPRTVFRSLRDFEAYEAIVGTTRAGAFAGTILKLAYRCPLVVDHVDPIRQFEETSPRWLASAVRHLENASFRIADHVLYVYEEERPRIAKRASSVTKTKLGVEYDQFSDPDLTLAEEVSAAIDSHQLGDNVAIYIGGLEPIYHIGELLAAIDSLDDWSLLVLGDGSLSDYVSEAAANRDDVAYPGTVSHERIPGYLHAVDVGVSLVDDPHTLKLLEYAAAGLPTVQASGRAEERFGDHIQYCDDTPESIAAAIERAADTTMRPGDGQSVARFDWANVADDYERALQNVM